MLAEVCLGALYLGFVNEANMANAAVGKGIDYGASKEVGQIVVDDCTYDGTQSAEHHYQGYVHLATCSLVGSGGYDHLGWEWDE